MVIIEHVYYIWSQQDYSIIFHNCNFSPDFRLDFNFCRDRAIRLPWTCSQGDYIRSRCANMTFTLCTMYDKSHAISYERNMTNMTNEMLFLSHVPLPLSSHWNHVTRMSTLIFTSFLFCYITPWHLAALKSWGGKKKHTFDVPLQNFKAERCCNWPWSN